MATVTLECAGCGKRWTVAPLPGGAMPQTSRCPKHLGGCGKLKKLPRGASTAKRAAVAPAPPAAGVWAPLSEPRGFRDAGGTCSDCHAAVRMEPRGTALWCSGCGSVVVPVAVLAPYVRGAEVTRAAKSQRERDLEALELARRKGIMQDQLADVAADDRLTPDSAAVVEWFADQVKAAASGARLDDLVTLFADAGIRRRRFWQGKPSALTAGYDDEDDDAPEGDACDGQDDAPVPAAVAATPAVTGKPRRMTWAEVISACGWRLSPVIGGCQLVTEFGRCGAGTAHHIGDGWLCGPHYVTLGGIISRDYDRQQRTA